MALSLASPGISIKEVDLTRGGINNTTSITAGIAGPFSKGPVNEITRITNENELVNIFGKPSLLDYQYEYWYSASNFLSYGGSLNVVRCGGTTLNNSNAGVGTTSISSLSIQNYDDYENNHRTDTNWYWAAKNPGSWANGIKVCVIDDFADQIISIASTTGISVGFGVTQRYSTIISGIGITNSESGILKGIVTGVGAVSGVSTSQICVKVIAKVISGQETNVEYKDNGYYKFATTEISFHNSSSAVIGDPTLTLSATAVTDWYNSQNILDISSNDISQVSWRSIAPKPSTNASVAEKGGYNDAFHVVVIDTKNSNNISGENQAILEKHLNISKATNALISPTENIYYRDYLALNSNYIYPGKSIGNSVDAVWSIRPVSLKFSNNFTAQDITSGIWDRVSDNYTFNSIGNKSFTLTAGLNYNNLNGYTAELSYINTAYDLFSNSTNSQLNFILQGSASSGKELEQAKANKIINITESRKDCVSFISPYRQGIVNVASETTQLNNILSFFSSLSSSSYAVFDTGYQYIYDRFNQQFVYIPSSADTAGLCARTDINQYPWYSPAGKSRGNYNNAIKLAYNPSKDHRDRLYSQRINPIISSPGSGIILFGDKTALSYQSAFDRINVRRLFISIEQAVKSAADSQLFEFNDATTRANFINIVDPYLRDVQIKRGITDYILICDESNNTPSVIDRNEFVANIFVKPARSINFIGLTFVATRTGVSFETVVGTI